MPNGLTSGPRVFTKLLKPPLALLRSMGIKITAYIDDTLIVAATKQQVEKDVAMAAHLFSDLGFVIHPEKSWLMPTQQITFLGFVIDSRDMLVKPTPASIKDIQFMCQNLLTVTRPHIRTVATVIGKLVSAFPAVEYGPLHYRELERKKVKALKGASGHFDRPMRLGALARRELNWWLKNIHSAVRRIDKGKQTKCITSDASGVGWGATDDKREIGGRWNPCEQVRARNNEINYLEMLAAFLALQAFCSKDLNTHVLLRLDNTTAVAYVNNMGGLK